VPDFQQALFSDGPLPLFTDFRFHSSPCINELALWLIEKKLTTETRSNRHEIELDGDGLIDNRDVSIAAASCQRAERATREDLKKLREKHKQRFTELLGSDKEKGKQIWQETHDPASAIRHLDIRRIPADAIAFYRPFHFQPISEWGVYILVPRLLSYCLSLESSLGQLKAFPREMVLVAVLFDVFHHEFFHHLVECTATAFEIMRIGETGTPRRIYLDYLRGRYTAEMGKHPDDPLEEALANAYAYNAFSFITRVKPCYLHCVAKLYQKALLRSWPREPAGYRSAGNYIKGQQINGCANLLAMILGTPSAADTTQLRILANCVFPRGHTAFVAKPDIPTYLVGGEDCLDQFFALVPAPNESYTSLFWPGETKEIDEGVKEQKKREDDAKKAAKQAKAGR